MFRLVLTGASNVPHLCIHEDVMEVDEALALAQARKHVASLAPVLSGSYWWAGLYSVPGNSLIAEWAFRMEAKVDGN